MCIKALLRRIADDGTCIVTVESMGRPDRASWYYIWEETVALEGMCARDERYGEAFALGRPGCHRKIESVIRS